MDEFELPFWFMQRQGKAEPAGTDTYRLTAPNMKEAFIRIQPEGDGRWAASVRAGAEGPDLEVTPADFLRPKDAWFGAFELYRRHFII